MIKPLTQAEFTKLVELDTPLQLTPDNDSFCLPVCIKATHRTTYTEFYVQENGKEFRPKKDTMLLFDEYAKATEFMSQLIAKHNDKWSFEIRSKAATI